MAKSKQQKTIIILMGLPASNKSTYAKNSGKIVVDFDRILKEFFGDKEKILYHLASHISQYCIHKKSDDSSNNIVIDGLITTNKEALSIIDYLKNYFKQYELIFKIVWWEEDREACLWNDRGRRDHSSEFSIKNLLFEEPDLSILTDLSKNRITKMKTQRKSSAVVWISSLMRKENIKIKKTKEFDEMMQEYHEFEYDENEELYDKFSSSINLNKMELTSSSWSLGGEWSNCWGDKGIISVESPLEFIQFDALIEKICPNISFLNYKKIMRTCCTTQEFDDGDYYSSKTSAKHICDLQKLYDILIEMKIIENILP